MTQNQALKILHSGDNVFITGSAGTGKTFLLNQFIQDLKKEEVNVAVTASTGIAATHLGGRTIHSWAGIGIADKMSDKEIKKMLKKRDNRQRIRSTKVLVIDEISMLDATRLDLVDQVCRLVKDPFLPFGGIQTVLCGDFFQLPPVSNSKVDNLFAYQAEVWSKADIQVCYLQERFRQQDAHFLELLDTIRANQAGENEVALLRNYRKHSVDGQESEGTKLFTHNIDVDAINNLHLRQIKGKEKEYHMTAHGPKDLVRFLKKSCLAPEHLVLKVGARVMFVRNNFEQNYVNGTLGQVISFEDDQPLIKTNAGDRILVKPENWDLEEADQVLAGIRQLPLRLAWAITVHKSQGMSLEQAEMDLSKCFEPGMGYVALSRVRTLDGVRLLGLNDMAMQVNPEVVKMDKEFKKQSK